MPEILQVLFTCQASYQREQVTWLALDVALAADDFALCFALRVQGVGLHSPSVMRAQEEKQSAYVP